MVLGAQTVRFWAKSKEVDFHVSFDGRFGALFEILGAHNVAIRRPIKTPLQAWIPPPNTSRTNLKRPQEIKQFGRKSTFKFQNTLILAHGFRSKIAEI